MPRKTVFNDTPMNIAHTLMSRPGEWFVLATAPRDDARGLRTAANRLQARRYVGVEKHIPEESKGRLEVTVRTEAAGDESKMYARWLAE